MGEQSYLSLLHLQAPRTHVGEWPRLHADLQGRWRAFCRLMPRVKFIFLEWIFRISRRADSPARQAQTTGASPQASRWRARTCGRVYIHTTHARTHYTRTHALHTHARSARIAHLGSETRSSGRCGRGGSARGRGCRAGWSPREWGTPRKAPRNVGASCRPVGGRRSVGQCRAGQGRAGQGSAHARSCALRSIKTLMLVDDSKPSNWLSSSSIVRCGYE